MSVRSMKFFRSHSRSVLYLLMWLICFSFCLAYFQKEKKRPRLDFFISYSGLISPIQRETWLPKDGGIQAYDQIISWNGNSYSAEKLKSWIQDGAIGKPLRLSLSRGQETKSIITNLRRYSPNDRLVLFVLPLIVSLVFLGFALGVRYNKEVYFLHREAVNIFSSICLILSLFFLGYLPALTLGFSVSLAPVLLLLSALMVHLFLVYPKEKISRQLRMMSMGIFYTGSLAILGVTSFVDGLRTQSIDQAVMVTTLLAALFAFMMVSHTLLTSEDFWARRRARLLSLVILGSFLTFISVLMAHFWDGPRFSYERILGASLVFPSAFAAIFLKENVFNLERLFRRGAHQLLFFSIAVSFAVLLGWAWNEWKFAPEQDWLLWILITSVIILAARPLSEKFEDWLHRAIQTKVRYPQVSNLAESSKSLVEFLESFLRHCGIHLRLRNLHLSFVQDPTLPYADQNSRIWTLVRGRAQRTDKNRWPKQYEFYLKGGTRHLGLVAFDGGDAIAFDPFSSTEWNQCLKDLSRALELLTLREFIQEQQGLMAAARMQALIAHQMKNPLAIIKVCSGILQTKIRDDEEADELLKTIHEEVQRVSKAVQIVFDRSVEAGQKSLVSLKPLVFQIRENALARFPDAEIESMFEKEEGVQESQLWMEEEGLKQTLSNLLVNALEAGSSKVKITVSWLKDSIRFEVSDNGPGFPESFELFKPFVTTKVNGTGLGLVHVKSFVDRAQGTIQIRSEKGKGATFQLDFLHQFVMNK